MAPSDRNFVCKVCGYTWIGRKDNPRTCPSCCTRKWDGFTRRTCCSCGYEWIGRSEDAPKRCPGCCVSNWDASNYRLQCRKCGYEWNTRGYKSSSETPMCPKCKTNDWMKTPEMAVCSNCHRSYVLHKLSKTTLCPACSKKSSENVCKCPFCDAEWVSKKDSWAVCPRCGFRKPDNAYDIRCVWTDGRRTLKFVRSGDFDAIYLWIGSNPVSAICTEEILKKTGLECKEDCFQALADYLESHADDCIERNSDTKKMLKISDGDYILLAYHFDGMSPEALALKFDTSLDEVRKAFDRIMAAYSRCGIPVNDNTYTENPQDEYRRYSDDTKAPGR